MSEQKSTESATNLAFELGQWARSQGIRGEREGAWLLQEYHFWANEKMQGKITSIDIFFAQEKIDRNPPPAKLQAYRTIVPRNWPYMKEPIPEFEKALYIIFVWDWNSWICQTEPDVKFGQDNC